MSKGLPIFPLYFLSHFHRHRAEDGLGTLPGWAMHAMWSASEWRRPVILLSGQSSFHAWLVQRDGTNHPRSLWPAEGLIAQCSNSRCPPGRADYCCRRLLFSQPDFVGHKSQLQELIKSRGHLCNFYPKYHCELNFIEQYWGTAKLRFRSMEHVATMEKLEKHVVSCLDNIPLLQIQR